MSRDARKIHEYLSWIKNGYDPFKPGDGGNPLMIEFFTEGALIYRTDKDSNPYRLLPLGENLLNDHCKEEYYTYIIVILKKIISTNEELLDLIKTDKIIYLTDSSKYSYFCEFLSLLNIVGDEENFGNNRDLQPLSKRNFNSEYVTVFKIVRNLILSSRPSLPSSSNTPIITTTPQSVEVQMKEYKHFFISYASENGPSFCHIVCQYLEKELGLNIWYDVNQINPGYDLEASIKKGLDESKKVIIVVSKEYLKRYTSKFLSLERSQAIKCKRDQIIPIWLNVSTRDITKKHGGKFLTGIKAISRRDVILTPEYAVYMLLKTL